MIVIAKIGKLDSDQFDTFKERFKNLVVKSATRH